MNKTAIIALLICTAAFAQKKDSFTDSRDKKAYKTVTIGKQTWMAENLNYNTDGSKCSDNKPANCNKYGRLYNWAEAMKACPADWSLPSKEEWQTLVNFAGGNNTAGKKLKAKSGWIAYEGKSSNGTDTYGFAALPGGLGMEDFFIPAGGDNGGNWWTASEKDAKLAHKLQIDLSSSIYFDSNDKSTALLSVRCIQSSQPSNSFTDSRDKKAYKTVTIGKQTWMAENLNYNAGGSVCYDNKPDNCDKYGRLYNWSAAKSACPKGWHLPSSEEWDALMTAVGGSSTAGTKLKAKSGWNGGGNGTDAYGFATLPGGYGNSDGKFGDASNDGSWWSATMINPNGPNAISMSHNLAYMNGYFAPETDLLSVRCVKNQ